jgi:hypothetical protein
MGLLQALQATAFQHLQQLVVVVVVKTEQIHPQINWALLVDQVAGEVLAQLDREPLPEVPAHLVKDLQEAQASMLVEIGLLEEVEVALRQLAFRQLQLELFQTEARDLTGKPWAPVIQEEVEALGQILRVLVELEEEVLATELELVLLGRLTEVVEVVVD